MAEGYAADAAYREGATPLHLAAAFGHGEIAALLLAHADNASLPDAKGHTPRHVSALAGHTDVEQLLLVHELESAHGAQRERMKGELRALRACAAQLRGTPAGSPEERFFPAEREPELPTISFLRLSPDTPAASLARHGLQLVERFDEEEQSFASPHSLWHEPPTAAQARACSAAATPSTTLDASRLAVVRAEHATATFDGLVFVPPAAAHAVSRDEKEESEVEKRVAYQVFSPSAEATPLLQNELIAGACHSGAYRLARSCPHAETDEATISACCVVASSEATAQLWLWPLLSGLASAGEGDEAEHYDTFFLEGLGANLTSRLLGCEARALLPPARKAHSSLLVWQPIWSGNFGHFLSEAMPRLLRLLPFLQARPEVNLYFAGGQAFNKDAFDLMFRRAGAAGLSERTLQYDPCAVHVADEMYVALASGRVLPSRATSSRLRKVLLPSPAPAQASTAQEDANEKLAHGQPYVLFVDRSDASSRKNPGQQQATVPRAILNMDQAAEEVSEELSPLGVKLICFQAAGMALAEQFRLVGGARGLIGVHGAGLSHALVLPEGAGLIEILPAKTGIPNRLTSSQ